MILNESHTSVTALLACPCMLIYLPCSSNECIARERELPTVVASVCKVVGAMTTQMEVCVTTYSLFL